MDENTANKNWIEAAWESFQESVEEREWSDCHDIIADVRSHYGDEEANKMSKALISAENEYMDSEEYLATREPDDYSNSTIEDYGL